MLGPETGVEARSVDAELARQVVDRGRFVAAAAKYFDRLQQRGLRVEAARSTAGSASVGRFGPVHPSMVRRQVRAEPTEPEQRSAIGWAQCVFRRT